ncbi:threonine aldolase family protein [Falsihalocynthiibacter arcticus]|uniref:Threonine aldolase n=1 Tax=Falsihalocynthiibacter arcticus TaxID=1579316 RepID=A0A126UWQ9_9RHOB|nr:beta-eliminating lyase-related protein [Falsihalocynthiibacter arcticus]AML50076.1 threonine aldolase [Falsihalocynthiibacter arcticus]
MFFASDNAGMSHPEVMQALLDANSGFAMPYGADAIMAEVTSKIRTIFEAPEAVVHLVATGTAANSLILACLARPFDTIFCSDVAHIHEDECNAPEFYTGGAKLTLIPTTDGKMSPQFLGSAIRGEGNRGVHGPQRGPISITQLTEAGTIYSLDEIAAITGLAKSYGLKTHMDGARFANAIAALGCTPAEMTWRVGVKALSFGGTKNGLLGVEAAIFFDPSDAAEFELRRKRGAHLFSKNRFLAAQMLAYLTDNLWLSSATSANENTAYLAEGLAKAGAEFVGPVDANIIFASLPRAAHQKLKEAGAVYHVMVGDLDGEDPEEPLIARFVCDWSISHEMIDQFLDILRT